MAISPQHLRRRVTWLLYIALGLYIALSLGYYIAGVIAVSQEWFHADRYARVPIDVDEQTGLLTRVQREAATAGLKVDDRLLALSGSAFTGDYQLFQDARLRRPGEQLTLTVQHRAGTTETLAVRLAPREPPTWNAAIIGLFAALVFLPLLGLSVGYWVVLARPRDLNAWLVLLVLTNPEVFFGNLDWRWWPNPWFSILGLWWVVVASLGDPALVLLAIRFPERWRVDVRFPWAKWLFLLPQILNLPALLLYEWVNLFQAPWGPAIKPAAWYASHVIQWFSLLTNVIFFVAVFDKMRTATNADARRRLRVLAIGSALSLGPVEVMFILFPLLGLDPQHDVLYELVVPFYVLFILTLAYVLVVQRAMDIRILLRMGTKYAIARVAVWLLRALLVMLIVILFRTPTSNSLATVVRIAIIIGLSVFLRFGLFKRLSLWIDRKFFREVYDTELLLAELSEHARRITETEHLIETVIGRLSSVLHVPQIAVWLRGSSTFHLQQALGIPAVGPVLLSDGSATVQTVSEAGRPVTLYRENPDEWFIQAPQEEQSLLNQMNTEVLLGLPGRNRLMGVIAMGPKQSEEPYTPSDLRLLRSVAAQTGLALEVSDLAQSLAREAAQRERMNRELEIAREVQERLFPQSLPALPMVELAGHCRPALGVGGDYYDFIQLEGNRLGIAIGDVSGKGISAALLMASLRASLRGMTLYGSSDLAELMGRINSLVYESSAANRYATFFFAVYDSSTGELRYVNAGHNAPLLLRDGGVVELTTGGPVIGLLPRAPFAQDSLKLQPGDVLLAYTDGISEAMTATDEEWGEERLLAALHSARSKAADQIVTEIFREADLFTAGAPQHDDMTLLVVKLA